MLALGFYPDVTLAEARRKREEAKRGIAVWIAPNVAKREERREKREERRETSRCPHCRSAYREFLQRDSTLLTNQRQKEQEEIRAQEVERHQLRNFIQKLAVWFVRVTRA